MQPKTWSVMWIIISTTVNQWIRHRTSRLGAALAFYSVFSLGPLLLIVTSVAGLFFGEDAVRGSLIEQFRTLLGNTGGQAVEAMLKGAASQQSARVTAGIGVILLLVAALGVVVQLKDALNTIWETEEPAGTGWWWYLRTYLISLVGILALGFLLTVSLVISTGLAAFSAWIGGSVTESIASHAVTFLISFAVLSTLFAMLFKFFPDAEVAWRDVWLGAIATSLLFNAGKLAISWYIGTQGLQSTYGAAGSIVVLLIWVYYSAQIVLFGAELTRVFAQRRGSLQPAH